jgi:hypothetical protein
MSDPVININDYTLRADGNPAIWTASGPSDALKIQTMDVGGSNRGLVVAAAFATDPRGAGVNVQELTQTTRIPTLSPPIPFIDVRGANAPFIFSVDTAVPYNIEKLVGVSLTQSTKGNTVTAKAKVITLIFPAILGRVALFDVSVPTGQTASLTVRAKSVRDDGGGALTKMIARSYDAHFTLPGAQDELLRLTYKVSRSQPFIDVYNQKTEVVFDNVLDDDIILIGASDTTPNASTMSVVQESDSVVTQVLLNPADAKYTAVLQNPDTLEQFTVGSMLAVYRVKEDGKFHVTLGDVSGSVMAIRLTPVVEVVTTPTTAYSAPEQLPDNLAYIEFNVKRSGEMYKVYPKWALDLQQNLQGSGALGQQANFPQDVLQYDPLTGEPLLWNETVMWSLNRADVTGANIPFGSAKVFPLRGDYVARRRLLEQQL